MEKQGFTGIVANFKLFCKWLKLMIIFIMDSFDPLIISDVLV